MATFTKTPRPPSRARCAGCARISPNVGAGPARRAGEPRKGLRGARRPQAGHRRVDAGHRRAVPCAGRPTPAVHKLLVSTSKFSRELTLIVKQYRADLKPALRNLQGVVGPAPREPKSLDQSLRLLAPFYRVFANTLGTGPWFDTWISRTSHPVPATPGRGVGDEAPAPSPPAASPPRGRRRGRGPGRRVLAGHGAEVRHRDFPRTVSVYEGSDVRVLGVDVGRSSRWCPRGLGSRSSSPTTGGHQGAGQREGGDGLALGGR